MGLGAALLRKVRVGARPLALRFSSNRGIAARPRFGQTLVWLAIGANFYLQSDKNIALPVCFLPPLHNHISRCHISSTVIKSTTSASF